MIFNSKILFISLILMTCGCRESYKDAIAKDVGECKDSKYYEALNYFRDHGMDPETSDAKTQELFTKISIEYMSQCNAKADAQCASFGDSPGCWIL